MTRVFYASTLFGAMSLAAALDAGLFGERSERRVLVTSNNSGVPEVVEGFDRAAAFAALRDRFDDVHHWNDVIAPLHPSGWIPRAAEVPMLQRLVRDRLGLGDDAVRELVLESVAVAPARTLGELVPDCPVTVYSDGLMSYGPTRDEVSARIGARLQRLLHLDLVPGLRPLLLREFAVPAQVVPADAFTGVLAQLAAPVVADAVGCPVVVGQYLSALGVLDPAAEVRLYGDLVHGLAARGHDTVVFAPHPAAGPAQVQPMLRLAAEAGVRLLITEGGLPVESWILAHRPALVVSCFSTALFTAQRWAGVPTACAGTDLVLERLTPYQNSNRVPATLVDATVPQLHRDGTLAAPGEVDVEALLAAVGYCMQAVRLPELRDTAADYLHRHGAQRYFKRRRLERLALVDPPLRRSRTVRRAAGAVLRSVRPARPVPGAAPTRRRVAPR